MSRVYNCKPSEILHLSEEYDAFCFDEACFFIQSKIDEGFKPEFDIKGRLSKQYSKASDLFKDLERSGVKCR